MLVRDRGGYVMRRHTGRRSVDIPVDSLGRHRVRSQFTVDGIERRAAGDGDKLGTIGMRGHAAVFNSPTWIGSRQYGFREQIAPSAFTKTIGEADVRLLLNHDPNIVLARNRAGNLRLDEDDIGLAVDADMVPTTHALDLALLMEKPSGAERATVDQMSFAFEIVKEEWEFVEDESGEGRGYDLYTITEARLWDVSIVTYPAYDDTDAALRAAAFDALTSELDMSEDAYRTLLRSVATGDRFPEIPALERTPEPATATRADSQPAAATDDTPNTDSLALLTRTRALNERSAL